MVRKVAILFIMQELRELRNGAIKIKQLKEQAERLRNAAMLLGSPSINPDKIQTTPANVMENTIIRLLDLEDRINRMTAKLEIKRTRIIKRIHKLDNAQHMDVLYHRYVNGMSYKQIASEMNISESYVPHLLSKALKQYRISTGRTR